MQKQKITGSYSWKGKNKKLRHKRQNRNEWITAIIMLIAAITVLALYG